MSDRVITPQKREEDLPLEGSLRPRSLAEYIGQEKVKENLEVFIAAARGRSEPLDHVLFHGFPGLGKTSLAAVISNELRVNLRSTSGPVIERPGDLAAILTNLEKLGGSLSRLAALPITPPPARGQPCRPRFFLLPSVNSPAWISV